MDLRIAAAVGAGRSAGIVARRLGRGGGTALPGVVATRVHPGLLEGLGRQLRRGRVLVTGTNGKTTTCRMLASIFAVQGVPVVHNREGSNLVRGIASTLLARTDLRGRLRGGGDALGLFEVDEATFPAAVRGLAPSVMTFTNLFRDQLDRYGEVDTVFAFWREALEHAPRDATLVLNADDPSVADLATLWKGPVHWFGLDDPELATDTAGAVDARWCGVCRGTFVYDERYFAHVGHWRCSGCGRARPDPDTLGSAVVIGSDHAEVEVAGLGRLTMPLTGVYNVYNALAAVATARVLASPPEAIAAGLANVRAAFGRQEAVQLEGRRLRLMLCKNPAGANQVLRLLAALPGGQALNVALLLNDRFADGQDVSWIWDVDYELAAGRVGTCWAAGDRAEDMALRMKYAGWRTPEAVVRQPAALLDAVLASSQPGDDVYVVPTYTAMLDLRAELARRGAAGQFWTDEQE